MVSPVGAELKVDGGDAGPGVPTLTVLWLEKVTFHILSLSTSNSSKLTSGVSSNVDGPKNSIVLGNCKLKQLE